MWGRRALERRGREITGSLEQRKRPARRVGRRPPAPGPGRPKGSERGTDGDVGYDGERERALPYELRYLATTLMRGVDRHSLWRVYPDTVCANGRDGRILPARKGLRAGGKEVTRPLSSWAAQKRTVTSVDGGLQSLEE